MQEARAKPQFGSHDRGRIRLGVPAEISPAWPRATTSPSRSRRRCCSRPMRAASSPWPRAPTTPPSTGSSRSSAASSRSSGARAAPAGAHRAPARLRGPGRHATSRRVIAGCAASRPGRRTTWINPKSARSTASCSRPATAIRSRRGPDGRLVGGLYGVALNGAFFGESMFSLERDASKVALVYLCARLVPAASAARYPVRHRAPEAVRRRRDRAARTSTSGWSGPGPPGGLLRPAQGCGAGRGAGGVGSQRLTGRFS